MAADRQHFWILPSPVKFVPAASPSVAATSGTTVEPVPTVALTATEQVMAELRLSPHQFDAAHGFTPTRKVRRWPRWYDDREGS